MIQTVYVNLFSKDGKSKLISAHHWDLEPKSLRVASVALSGRLRLQYLFSEEMNILVLELNILKLWITAYTTFLLLNGTVEEIFPVEIDVKLQELVSLLELFTYTMLQG